jgi:hypothetical protein
MYIVNKLKSPNYLVFSFVHFQQKSIHKKQKNSFKELIHGAKRSSLMKNAHDQKYHDSALKKNTTSEV